jgi:hypothetical protein
MENSPCDRQGEAFPTELDQSVRPRLGRQARRSAGNQALAKIPSVHPTTTDGRCGDVITSTVAGGVAEIVVGLPPVNALPVAGDLTGPGG